MNDILAFNHFYDIDNGLGMCTGAKNSIGGYIQTSKRRYFGASKVSGTRLVFKNDTPCDVGPGSYELKSLADIQKANMNGSFYKSNVSRFSKLEWSVPHDLYSRNSTEQGIAPMPQLCKTECYATPSTTERIKKLPYGRFGSKEKREFNTVSWANSDPRCLKQPYYPATTKCDRCSVDRSQPKSKPSGATLHTSFGTASDRKSLDSFKKRQKDVIPEDYFVLRFDRRNQ